MDILLSFEEFLALHPYCEGEAGDLSFQTGDLVIVTDMKEDGWWYGFSGEQEGWFPGTYVEVRFKCT